MGAAGAGRAAPRDLTVRSLASRFQSNSLACLKLISAPGLGLAPSPGAQRLRSLLPLSRRGEEVGDGYAKHRCQRFQGRDRYVLRAALNPADVGPVDPRRERQSFLGQAQLDPQPSKIPADNGARFHGPSGPDPRLDNRRTASPTFRNLGGCKRRSAVDQPPHQRTSK